MNCKITRNAAKVLARELAKPENEGKKVRVYITHSHGDHVHYGIRFDTPTDRDEVVRTDKDIDVILESGEEWLDGVKIDYLYFPYEHWEITNPSKGFHAHH